MKFFCSAQMLFVITCILTITNTASAQSWSFQNTDQVSGVVSVKAVDENSADRYWRFNSLSFTSPASGWATTGARIAKYNGTLVTAIERNSEIPQGLYLSPNYPNPFRTSTTIRFTLDRRAPVRLSIFDLLGIEVAVPLNEELEQGVHETVFEAGNLPSGVYFYRIRAGEFVQTRKLTIVR